MRASSFQGGVAPMPDSGAKRRTTGDEAQGAEEGAATGQTEGYTRVSPCIILRSLEKPKATAGCVTFAALPMGA